ncbi:unnamed protein product [Phytophthora lilii]|uniref:ATP-dependent DNA helicase n=1 Tax=Phytophthora lilii TaxID=2077276 RepID=A0A9W6X5B8_9STRA|nr:unnamed protein product [Phytophthora lilii]
MRQELLVAPCCLGGKAAESLNLWGDALESTLRSSQLLFFLGGEGGTGKSRVIDAVQALCESWGRLDCIVKTAFTGKEATIVSGRTLASFLLQIRKHRTSDAINSLEVIIIDEVSMMKKYQLAQLDKYSRVAKRVTGVAFEGVHVILVGDFLQLPPVGGTPLYADPNAHRKHNKISINEVAGYHLWKQFTSVIVLKESVRFHKDPMRSRLQSSPSWHLDPEVR